MPIIPALNNALRMGLGRSGGAQLKALLEDFESRLAALEGQSEDDASPDEVPPSETDDSMASDLSSPKRRGRPPKQR